MAFVETLDLSVARTNEPIDVYGSQIVVVVADADATIRLEKTNADAIPALEHLEICTCAGDTITRIFISNPAAGAGDELTLHVV